MKKKKTSKSQRTNQTAPHIKLRIRKTKPIIPTIPRNLNSISTKKRNNNNKYICIYIIIYIVKSA